MCFWFFSFFFFPSQHCRNLAPEYETVAKSFKSLVPLYAVDCDAEENKPLYGQQASEHLCTRFGR